jgi:hypothetical protein
MILLNYCLSPKRLEILSGFCRRSVVATDKLRKVQISIDNFCTKKLKPDVTTKWSSLFDKGDLILTDSDWGVISNVIAVLTPFEEATIELSSKSYPQFRKSCLCRRF